MEAHSAETTEKGVRTRRAAIPIGDDLKVVVRRGVMSVGSILDEFWLPSDSLPPLESIIRTLRSASGCPDVFTIAERLPAPSLRLDFATENESLAVATFSSYEEWFDKVNRSVRKHIRKAEREGIVVAEAPFNDELVAGIHRVYNEVPVRQGRPFWHFGKDLAVVRADNATFLDRSVFLTAHADGDFVGFLKMVEIEPGVSALMQILSTVAHQDRRPTNALLAKAVEVCARRGVKQLVYGHYAYGSKESGSLVDFKQANGFERVDVPRYFIPLSAVGRVGLKLGLHRPLKDRIPPALRSRLVSLRARWHATRGAA
ncbi:hypothetical protein TBR22_A53050 [Luteitalea sp. TBR-22]|uniref:GNAT family N-acetyltransferase n=1 Tax=Luteitalea sp. TBR-22 TaxID=2802971 RepID=UPI001AFCB7B9|nr:GNAT family N-acetyltransferase [Luteitalea sp. TBR-22]BCS36068.1 hypothetical protein TBR22_A53050 [Luteitalea sp. TBR-22]